MKEQGASLVETALAAPLVLLLVFGVVDFGRVFFTAIRVRDAVQEGAIYASYSPGDHTIVRDRVLDSINTDLEPDLQPTDVSVTCPPDGSIEVSVQYSVSLITPVIRSMSGGPITLTHTAVGRNFSSDICDPSP
ncbi:MAG: TadE/TadG family type IV pilus assembly protein [Acidimicrobiia bacterium]